MDSLDSAAEGIGERDSAAPARAIAALLDIARQKDGPAILLLGNTIKSAQHSRGSGVVEERADIVYEVRDATDLRPTGNKPWIEELPSADAGAWAQRTAHRQHRDRYRLAFVPTKFRIGSEPEPFILEVDLSREPWTLTDVTDQVDLAGTDLRKAQELEQRQRLDRARSALFDAIETAAAAGSPITKGGAEKLLQTFDLTRQAARDLIETASLWRTRPGGR